MTVALVVLGVAGLLAMIFGSLPIGLCVSAGAIATISHRRFPRYWFASIGSSLVAAAVNGAAFTLAALAFDPYFASWHEAVRFLLETALSMQLYTLPIALLVGVPFRRAHVKGGSPHERVPTARANRAD